MGLDDLLRTATLIDCTGQVTHVLTLRIDGSVEVRFANGTTAVADPRSRTSLTTGVPIPEALWPEITSMGA
jgi:hypothetical protein